MGPFNTRSRLYRQSLQAQKEPLPPVDPKVGRKGDDGDKTVDEEKPQTANSNLRNGMLQGFWTPPQGGFGSPFDAIFLGLETGDW